MREGIFDDRNLPPATHPVPAVRSGSAGGQLQVQSFLDVGRGG